MSDDFRLFGMVDDAARFLLQERESTSPHRRQALELREPPVPVEIEVSYVLRDSKARWESRPIWARSAGLSTNPVTGLLYAWIWSSAYDLFGIVSMELRSSADQLRLVLPYHLVPRPALRLATSHPQDPW